MDTQLEINQLLQKGLVLQGKKQFADAESLYHRVLSINPDQYDALRLLGVSSGQQGDYASAAIWLIKALQVNPTAAVSHHDLGLAWSKVGRFDEAIEFLKNSIQLQPKFPEAYLSLGNVYFQLSSLDEAVRCYEQALIQQPEMTEAKAWLDRMSQEEGQLKKLVEEVRMQVLSSNKGKEIANSTEPRLPRRELLPHFLNELNLTGTAVEIGVQEGIYSALLLRNWKGRVLYSVDPWKEFSVHEYADVGNVSQATQDECYKTTLERLMPFQSRSVIWRLTSKDAAALIEDESLDFCYLDGDHSLAGVREDVSLWYPKVKRGGILAGHDYIPDGDYPFGTFGVKGAVDEFVASRNLRLFITDETVPTVYSWFVFRK